MNIAYRIAELRKKMVTHRLDAYLITGTDPHLSEYIPDRWRTREWISGFTGSYGKVLVTLEKVMLWTDTRYFLQAMEELEGSSITLMKDRFPGAISIEDWIYDNLVSGQIVGVDGMTLSAIETRQLESKLAANGIQLDAALDLVDVIWKDRPNSSEKLIYDYPILFAGKSRSEKIDLVRIWLESKNLDSTIITQLDDIAWLFNLRGDDIQYTPLFNAYAYLELQSVWLFVQKKKLSKSLIEMMASNGITIMEYGAFYGFLQRINDKRIQIDPIRTNSAVVSAINSSNYIESSVSIVGLLKSVKDDFEIENIRYAHTKDGAAMVNSLYWLYNSIGKAHITEVSMGRKLKEFRNEQDFFKGESFHPIVGFGPHGAIVHYHATGRTDSEICKDNLLLIDSGGQYMDGTTDITRTVGFGLETEKQKEDFSICLKAHISLAMAVFPEGTKGYSLDPLARKQLWDKGINYGHGTGHGIGYFLSVHEGPMSIRTEFNNELIQAGNLISNEPGIYREGEYGIRIENVLLCKSHSTGKFGKFLCFETVSYCPIDRHLINIKLLNKEEINWIDQYHATVLSKVLPLLKDLEVCEWLKAQCAALDES
jgi:Xaa-Pro aminopeptidase